MVTADDIKGWIEANLPESHVVFAEGEGRHTLKGWFCALPLNGKLL